MRGRAGGVSGRQAARKIGWQIDGMNLHVRLTPVVVDLLVPGWRDTMRVIG